MDAGELDRQITILQRVGSQLPSGKTTYVDEPVATGVWAKRMEQRLGEVFAAGADRQTSVVVWRIRWRDGLTAKLIVAHGDERWDVQSVQEIARKQWLNLVCHRVGASANV